MAGLDPAAHPAKNDASAAAAPIDATHRSNRMVTMDRDDTAVDSKLLEILVCPLTKGPLEYDSARQELVSRSAKLAYPIRDGIPIMLADEARALD
jgi:uncharacterized protein YbaR (Trm112 family)